MAQLTIAYPDEAVAASGQPQAGVDHELKLASAIHLFEKGWVSLGMAAQVAEVSNLELMDELARRGLPVINLDARELEVELRAIRGVDHR